MSERVNFPYNAEFERNPYPGLLIAVEGLDGSGGTTQVSNLYSFFQGEVPGAKIWATREPFDGPIGGFIRLALGKRLKIDNQTLQLTFSADRSDHLLAENGIIDRLKQAWIIICDRYSPSTPAYGYAAGLDIKWLWALQSKFILPDLTFFLDLPPETCLERKKQSNFSLELYEELETLRKTREGYELLMEMMPDLMVRIDGSRDEGLVYARIKNEIVKLPKFQQLVAGTVNGNQGFLSSSG